MKPAILSEARAIKHRLEEREIAKSSGEKRTVGQDPKVKRKAYI
jgi:hypothetical protein